MVSCNIKMLKYPCSTLKRCPVFSKPVFNTVFMSDGGFLISCLNALWFTCFKQSWNGPGLHALKQLPQKNIKNMETAGGTRWKRLLVSQQNKHGHSNLRRAGLSRVISWIPPSKQETISFFCWEQSDLHEMWSAGDSPQCCSAATHTHTNPDMVAHLARYFKLILNRELNELPYGGRGVDIRGKTRRNQSWNNDMLLMCCSSFH